MAGGNDDRLAVGSIGVCRIRRSGGIGSRGIIGRKSGRSGDQSQPGNAGKKGSRACRRAKFESLHD
jgi:hypothetical protein